MSKTMLMQKKRDVHIKKGECVMRKITLFVSILLALSLGGCGERTILDSLTDASTMKTMEACFTCVEGVRSRAEGEAKLDEFSELLKDIETPVEQ